MVLSVAAGVAPEPTCAVTLTLEFHK